MLNGALQLILACAVLLTAYRKRGLRLALPLGLIFARIMTDRRFRYST